MRRLPILFGSTALAAILAVAATADARGLIGCSARERGCAIQSPIDSPDLCDSPVGGIYRIVPYYCGYTAGHQNVAPMYAPSSGYGYGYNWPAPGAKGSGNYGYFTGARKDEANLKRLGGIGAGGNTANRSSYGSPVDIIDLIGSNR